MRGLRIDRYGAAPVVAADLTDLHADPRARRVVAAGINPADLAIATGGFYAMQPEPPFTPGLEGVVETPGGLAYCAGPADPRHGTLAQVTLADDDHCFALPPGATPQQAIACGVAGLAGWLSVRARGALRPGEVVVVLGATGAAGRVAVQAARLGGAGAVVAAGRDPDRLAALAELGADVVVPLSGELEADRAALSGATDEGADLIVDFVWGASAAAAIAASAPGARLVQAGSAAGPQAPIPAPALRAGDRTITGYSNFNVPLAQRRAAFGELLGAVVAGRLQVECETVALEQAPSAWARQARSPGRKLVVQVA